MKAWGKISKKNAVVAVLIFLLLIMDSHMLLSLPHTEHKKMGAENEFCVKAYTPHGIIRINNDSEFARMAANEGWPGNGSETDPYIIEGYEIDAQGEGNAIYIGNTTKYFIVRYCKIHNATSYEAFPYFEGAGIIFYKVLNGKIANDTIYSNRDGILFYTSNNNTVANTSIFNNSVEGINLWNSDNNIITNNTIYNNSYDGIYLYDGSNQNYISNNYIRNNIEYGVYIYSGNYNIIQNNTFLYNHGSGDNYNPSQTQARDSGDIINYWNTSQYGNYWHDWANNNNTNDQDGDGIVDWPYPIDGSAGAKDYYPLKNPTIVPEFPDTGIAIFLILIGIFVAGRRFAQRK